MHIVIVVMLVVKIPDVKDRLGTAANIQYLPFSNSRQISNTYVHRGNITTTLVVPMLNYKIRRNERTYFPRILVSDLRGGTYQHVAASGSCHKSSRTCRQ
jgi:hypothetical protein